MSSIEETKPPLRRFQESLVKAFYPDELDDPVKVDKRISELLYDLEGVPIPGNGFPRAAIEKVKHFKPRDGDILIATYPRSGTHWVHAMLLLILNRDNLEEISNPEVMHERITGIDSGTLNGIHAIDQVEKWQGKRVFSTHLLPHHCDHMFENMMKTTPLKVIYVARDVRDVLASMYFFMTKLLSRGHFHATFDEVFEIFKQKMHIFGDWYDHVGKWQECSNKFPSDKFMFLKFEDIKADQTGFIRKMAGFCGIKLDENLVDEIVKLTSFDRMKSIMNKSHPINTPPPAKPVKQTNDEEDTNNNEEESKEEFVPLMARKGIVGDWKSLFTPKSLAEFEEIYANKEPFKSLYGHN